MKFTEPVPVRARAGARARARPVPALAPARTRRLVVTALTILTACTSPPLTQTHRVDWLVHPVQTEVRCTHDADRGELTLDNGLVRRTWRLAPNAATIAIDDLSTGRSFVRAVEPEALVELDGKRYAIGGLTGQPDHAYLRADWLDELHADPGAFRFDRFEVGPIRPRLEWKRKRYSGNSKWPPDGKEVVLWFRPPADARQDIAIAVHHEMYRGLPLLATWLTIHNRGDSKVRVDRFTSVDLAIVEQESAVEPRRRWALPDIHVETDYAMHGMDVGSSNKTIRWVADPEYRTQVNYRRRTPVLLQASPPIGPSSDIAPGGVFESFRTWMLVHDSSDRERQGLAVRRMYRTIAPWVTENPIMMHVRRADPAAVELAIDQCAEVGFELVILTFGSGFNIENDTPQYLANMRELADYAHAKGIELGGYSLLASRSIGPAQDVINPNTGKPGGAIFGNSPCLGSEWGNAYFKKLYAFFERTGMDLLEHDGSYPGDVCASKRHPGHRGLDDSQWRQWRKITKFYKWCRARGIYLNVPDYYLLSGSSKVPMGYRETNWSLPRAQQIVHARQNMFDGTWTKTPSMGWMFVPLVEYHGGGPAATIEPLSEHLDAYEAHLANNFGYGVQACYRGPRLFDTDETKAVVSRWVNFYKRYRHVLDGDVIHLRRADGRDLDGVLHVDPTGPIRGLLVVYNPLDRAVRKTLSVPLYYTGLTRVARIRDRGGDARDYTLDREYRIEIAVEVPAGGAAWYVVERGS